VVRGNEKLKIRYASGDRKRAGIVLVNEVKPCNMKPNNEP